MINWFTVHTWSKKEERAVPYFTRNKQEERGESDRILDKLTNSSMAKKTHNETLDEEKTTEGVV